MTHRGNNNQRAGLTVALLALLLVIEIALLGMKWILGIQHWLMPPVIYGLPGLAGILVVLQPRIDGMYRPS
jgi:hypothetical protein